MDARAEATLFLDGDRASRAPVACGLDQSPNGNCPRTAQEGSGPVEGTLYKRKYYCNKEHNQQSHQCT